MGARFYDPGTGGFTQLDDVMGSAQDPLSMNRFLYAEGDPTTLVDPTGHGTECQIGYACGQAERATEQRTRSQYEQRQQTARRNQHDERQSGGREGNRIATTAHTPTIATRSFSDLTRMSRDQLIEYQQSRQAACSGQLANAPGCQDFGFAHCLAVGLSQGICTDYAGLKDVGDLDGPIGTLAIAPAAAIAVAGAVAAPAIAAWLSASAAALRDKLQALGQASAANQMPIMTSAEPKLQRLMDKFGMSQDELIASVLNNGTKYVDRLNKGNVNVLLQRPDGADFIRITLDPSMQRIISAGIVRARSLYNGIESGRFLPLGD